MAKIYISSTYSDLKDYREEVYHTLRQMRHDVIAMEDYTATDQRPLQKCLEDVAASDIYIGIFAWRYGFVPETGNSERKSITELEYREAQETGKKRLIFLVAEDYPWPPTSIERGEGASRLEAFRAELANGHTAGFFRSKEDLAKKVSAAVHNCMEAAPAERPRPTTGQGEANLGPLVPKLCNRSSQETAFTEFFVSHLNQRPGAPQVYILHGEEQECHDSLVERLVHTQIRPKAERKWGEQRSVITFKKLQWPWEGELEELQIELKRSLFAEFDPGYMEEDLSASALAYLPSLSLNPVVVLRHNLYARQWSKLTSGLLQWYISSYWARLGKGQPQFLLFLSVIYPREEAGGWWKGLLGAKRHDKKRIQEELRQLSVSPELGCPCLLLRELIPPKQHEVGEWFSRFEIYNARTQAELLQSLFKKPDIPMATIEHELQKIHDRYVRERTSA